MFEALKRWFSGAETEVNNVLTTNEQAIVRAVRALPYRAKTELGLIEREAAQLVGADIGKLKEEAETAAQVLSDTATALHNELVRLQGEYTNTVLALRGQETLIAHYAGDALTGLEAELDAMLKPADGGANITMKHTGINDGSPSGAGLDEALDGHDGTLVEPVYSSVGDHTLPLPQTSPFPPEAGHDPVLEAGNDAAAKAAREVLGALPARKRKVWGQT